MNKENQSKITELIRQTKPLIFREMTHEKVIYKFFYIAIFSIGTFILLKLLYNLPLK